MVKNYKTKMIM